ncbi:N-acetylglutamate synthase, CG3035 family [Rhodococcus tibetensis]|uniref:GNAT family N-acetyltransferase n=1 Tax=Rhodococcus tibetensis TaxID=2965064 RepID=A0ABT1QI61_9NOCA|nr:GNAT family N-acetyltransferase [Rhodococcus sp. FXJ9.536]MCQ4120775.1 GNAT family N-acetyltransferase [Rhodococcus sp. FXJ9.536]
MTTDIPPGSRVVLRYALPPGHSHPMTDIVGILESVAPFVTVRASDGSVVEVEPERVIALKIVPARPVRASEIRALELASADGWPGVEHAWIDGWLARYGHGFTGRANSAAPLGDPGTVGDLEDRCPGSTLERLRNWYAERERPLRLLIPDRLGAVPLGWHLSDEVVVMAADIANLALPQRPLTTTITARPDPDWLALYRYRGSALPDFAVDLLGAVRGGTLGFGRIGAADSTLLAVARGSVTSASDGRLWVGLTAVEVAEAHRRRGIGSLICGEMITWGREHGATHASLQVAAENEGAQAMYRSIGFVPHHRYRYATEPVGAWH